MSCSIDLRILVFERSKSLGFWRAVSMAPLSFLGLSIQAAQTSLGLLIANGFEYILSGSYLISKHPGIALLIIIVSINLARH